MSKLKEDFHSEVPEPFYYSNGDRRWLPFAFTASGIVVSVLWLCLFVAGLLVDSAYYRSAISYNFGTICDWFMAIISFTFSNVVLLAFMSGLLGGITSKLLYTRGFRITAARFAKVNPFQIENPFISAFRGMFVFIAILFMQYVSSYSDLGAINKIPEQEQKAMEIKFEKIYSKFTEVEKDEGVRQMVRSEMDKNFTAEKMNEPDTSSISKIHLLKAKLKALESKINPDSSDSAAIKDLEMKIGSLRRNLKVPSNSDFAGIGLSALSYFKFAVIVSFLSFMFGYDPSLFTEFIGKIFKKPNDTEPVKEENKS